MALTGIRNLVSSELNQVDDLIVSELCSDVPLVNAIGHHIVNSGGKRVRPMLSLLSAKLCGEVNHHHIQLASVIEFIHTATLLHDDVVDLSSLRRGMDTANSIWGNQSSVLVGDYLYSRSFQLMVKINNLKIMEIMANTTNRIAEGEVLQLMYAHNSETSEAQYLEVINRKTAILFAAACEAAGVISGVSPTQQTALANFGLHLGMAYQLVDDALDYDASAKEMGKNCGDDLKEGKVTLPLIIAMQKANEEQKNIITQAIKAGQSEQFDLIKQTIDTTESLHYTYAAAEAEAKQAKQALDAFTNPGITEKLSELLQFVLQRRN